MTIRFEDIRLELAVREALDRAGLEPARVAELRSLQLASHGIRRLGGIAQLTGLRWLNLRRNPLTTFAPLAGLPALTSLALLETPGISLRPLAGLASLESFDARDVILPNIDALAHISALRHLMLIDCLVRNIQPLASLGRLESLSLGNRVYADPPRFKTEPLDRLVSLRELRLLAVRLPSVATFEHLVSLESLILDGCTVVDKLASFPALPRLRHLSLARTKISNLWSLENLIQLESLDLSETEVVDLSPLAALRSLRVLNLADTSLRARDVDKLGLPYLSEVHYPVATGGRYVF